jgi:ankyrin repeat protein
MISSFDPSKLSALERWSLYRSNVSTNIVSLDNQMLRRKSRATTIPHELQKRVIARLQLLISSHADSTTMGRALFELSMCYFSGFGVERNVGKMLDLLRAAVSLKNPMAMSIFHRAHEAFSQAVPSNIPLDDPILQIEDELQRLPTQEYFSARIRRHEKLFQQFILGQPFDLFSNGVLIAKGLNFREHDEIQNIVAGNDIKASSLMAVSPPIDPAQMGSFLHLSARLGLLSIVKLLVTAGADINRHIEGCGTPLTAACRGGHAAVVHFFLSNGASAKRQSGTGPTPLHWMIMFEEDELAPLIKALQDHSGDVNAFSFDLVDMREHALKLALSPLHFAVAARYYGLTEALLRAGAGAKSNQEFMTPLDLAVANGFPELTTLLLKYKRKSYSSMASPLLLQQFGFALGELLMHGSSARHMLESTVDILLKSNFSDVNVEDEDGQTPLDRAVRDSPCEINLDRLDVLIDRGAYLKVTPQKLIHGLGRRYDQSAGRIMKLLLDKGKVNPGPSLLNQACLYGDEGILRSILEFGVDVNLPEQEEGGTVTALQCATLISGSLPIVRALLDHGADINAKQEGHSVLEICTMSPIGDGDVIDLLIEHGIELASSEGTILHVAARLFSRINGSHILFHLLRHDRVRALINVAREADDQSKPLQIACISGNIEALSALVEAGAHVETTGNFNPVDVVKHLGRNPEQSPNWKDEDFDVFKHQLVAERTLLMLLDKIDPNHGKTFLHLAATIGNYDRVVMLVERGANVWASDSEKLTPVGQLPPEAANPDSEASDPGMKTYLQNAKRIYEYLGTKMIEATGKVTTIEDLNDVSYAVKEFVQEDDSPDQLETRYVQLVEERKREFGEKHPETLSAMFKLAETYDLQDRKPEAEALNLKIFKEREVILTDTDHEFYESRSNHIHTLYHNQNREEAKQFAAATLELALDRLGAKHHDTYIARFDTSVVLSAERDIKETVEDQKNLLELLAENADRGYLHRDALAVRFNIICAYCALGCWDDATREMEYFIGSLDLMAKEMYPEMFLAATKLAGLHEMYGKLESAQHFYEKLQEQAQNARGDHSYYTATVLRMRVESYQTQQKFKEASEILLTMLEFSKAKHGFCHLNTQQLVLELAELYEEQDRLAEANVLEDQAVDALQDILGQNDEQVLQAKCALRNNLRKRGLWELSERVAREIASGYLTTLGEDHSMTINAENELASILTNMDQCAEATELQEKVVQNLERIHGEEDLQVRAASVSLAATYMRDGRLEEAELLLRKVVAVTEEAYGAESKETALCLAYLAIAYVKADRRRESAELYERVLKIERTCRDPNDPETIYTMRTLSRDYFALEQFDKAIDLQVEVLERYRTLYGEQHINVLKAMLELGISYGELKCFDDAEKLYKEALDGSRELLGDSHDLTLEILNNFAILYADLERWEDARPLAQEALTRTAEKYGNDDSKTIEAKSGLAAVYNCLELWPKGESLQREVVESLKRTVGDDDPQTINAIEMLAQGLENQQNYKDCEELWAVVLEHRLRTLGTDDESTMRAMDSMVNTFIENDKYTEAEKLHLEVLEVLRGRGEDDETYIDARSTLATIYWHQDRFAEAEAIELDIVEKRTRSLGEDDPLTLKAIASLAQTYFDFDRFIEAEGLHLRILDSKRKGGCSDLDPDVLTSMKHLENICIKLSRWDEARVYATKLLNAMKELAPENDGRGILSALSDLRKVYVGLKEKELLHDLDREVRFLFILLYLSSKLMV